MVFALAGDSTITSGLATRCSGVSGVRPVSVGLGRVTVAVRLLPSCHATGGACQTVADRPRSWAAVYRDPPMLAALSCPRPEAADRDLRDDRPDPHRSSSSPGSLPAPLPGDSLLFIAGFFASTKAGGNDPHLNLAVVLDRRRSSPRSSARRSATGSAGGTARGCSSPTRGSSRPSTSSRPTSSSNGAGAPAIVLARFIPFVRTIVPMLAGASRMPQSAFTTANVIGAAIWVDRHHAARLLPRQGDRLREHRQVPAADRRGDHRALADPAVPRMAQAPESTRARRRPKPRTDRSDVRRWPFGDHPRSVTQSTSGDDRLGDALRGVFALLRATLQRRAAPLREDDRRRAARPTRRRRSRTRAVVVPQADDRGEDQQATRGSSP